uniref:hypothetical protein n=1 Tax=Paractinoplanes polyasparticus TaxID=2856853 RepID=UPI001C85FA8A|nr:hypothetical protein [Actinoplanes polyasparticus]
MAQVLVASDDGATVVEIVQDDEVGAFGVCPCGDRISDRGHFEDTVQAVEVHVDTRH